MRKTNTFYLFAIVFITVSTSIAQTVSMMIPTLVGTDGLGLDRSGNIYLYGQLNTAYDDPENMPLTKITPDGVVSTVAIVPKSPGGPVVDDSGNIYVPDHGAGIIRKITQEGVVSEFVTGLDGPISIVIDPSGCLYVATPGQLPELLGKDIIKITPEGLISNYATVEDFDVHQGMALDNDNNLYVANFRDGKIHKITPDSVITLFATIPGPPDPAAHVGWITFGGNNLYSCSYNNHIYKISMSGEVSVFAGTGAYGFINGPAATATFYSPNSIVSNSTADTIYVSEWVNQNRQTLRAIITEDTDIDESNDIHSPKGSHLNQNYPNPFNPETTIQFGLPENSKLSLRIYNTSGKLIRTLLNEYRDSGNHSVLWNSTDDQGQKVSSGLYYYTLETENINETRSLILLK